MSEKTQYVNRKNTFLRLFFAVTIVCSILFVSIGPVTVKADKWYDPIDYQDLDYTVKYGTEYNTVTFPLPQSHFVMNICAMDDPWTVIKKTIGKSIMEFSVDPTNSYVVRVYPAGTGGLSLDNLPVGSRICFDLVLGLNSYGCYYGPNICQASFYYANEKNVYQPTDLLISDYTFYDPIHMEYVIEDIDGATSFSPFVYMQDFEVDSSVEYELVLLEPRIEMEVSVEYWTQWQNQQNGELLNDISDSLGNLNDKVDTLPEDIGNEMQGVIDSENEKAESSGNKFVNQILDALPDPSTEVLSSLKSLTDATAYTGTDAKLKIPALVIPAVDGLFPETELWGGTEFSFSDYLSFLPPALLTVVQSLFTIAIVLFCVYELKGIISYCLTLNDKKGG